MMRANDSAVFILVSDAPILCGRYVTRARIGFMRALCHVGGCVAEGEFMSRIHSVAAAVIIGYGVVSSGGVSPPSTAMNMGESVFLISSTTGERSWRIHSLLVCPIFSVPCVINDSMALLTSQVPVVWCG